MSTRTRNQRATHSEGLDSKPYDARHMTRQVFVSHASANADVALAICNGLEARGVSCWIAPRDVAFDGTYGSEIVKGVRECDVFLIVVTEAAAASQQVEREAERASHYGRRIIPVIVGRSDPGPRLEFYVAGRQQFPCPTEPDEHFFADLTAAIRSDGREGVATPARANIPRTVPPTSIRLGAAAIVVLLLAVGAYVLTRPSTSEITASVPGPDVTAPPASGGSPPPVTASSGNDGRAGGAAPSKPDVVKSANDSPALTTAATKDVRERPNVPSGAPGESPPARPSGGLSAIANGMRLAFIALPPGTFRMGCATGDSACADDESPPRTVSVQAFQMSATEVTQEFWQAVMGSNPSDFQGARQPVEGVTWQDAQAFAARLSESGDGFRYRLPTEAEWEYAARAGETTAPDLAAAAWFGLAAGGGRPPRPQAVGTKSPNRWGLFDMLGNVAEWCEDWYSPNYQRVVKGGAWDDGSNALRASARGKAVPSTRVYSIGLRLVREAQ